MKYFRSTTDIARQEAGSNVAPVAVGAGATPVTSVNIGSVKTGDSILLVAQIYGQKGAAPGSLAFNPTVAGTGSAIWPGAGAAFESWHRGAVAANEFVGFIFVMWLRVTGPGGLTVGVEGLSAGSNFTVGADECNINATVLSGSVV